jgi:hypothetical protein
MHRQQAYEVYAEMQSPLNYLAFQLIFTINVPDEG